MEIQKQKLYMIQDESIVAYEDGECPYTETKDDAIFTQKLKLKYGDITQEEYDRNIAKIEADFADRE